MPYIPKNRILTNLKTTPNEFVYKANNKPYDGIYWKDYKGKYYTGENPNVKPTYEIIKVIPYEEYTDPNKPTSRLAIIDAPFLIGLNTPNGTDDWNENLVIEYGELKGENTMNPEVFNLPSMFYPAPTDEDYKIGEFRRYFCIRVNQNIFLEIDKNTYKAIKGKDKSFMWEYYKPFFIDWVITGNEMEVRKTNRNLILLKEKRGNAKGLDKFLKGQYTKYYRDLNFSEESTTTPPLPSQDELNPPSEPQNDGNNY